MGDRSVVRDEAATTRSPEGMVTTQEARWAPPFDSQDGPRGRLDIDLAENWMRFKKTWSGWFTLNTIDLLVFILLMALYIGLSTDEFDAMDALLGVLWSGAIVLMAYHVMMIIAWARSGPSPAIYEYGVLLVRTEAMRLGTFSYYYTYKDLGVPRRTVFGLRVRSKDGQSWTLRRDVFGEEWLRKVEERVLYAPTGKEPPRLVLYPKSDDRMGDGDHWP